MITDLTTKGIEALSQRQTYLRTLLYFPLDSGKKFNWHRKKITLLSPYVCKTVLPSRIEQCEVVSNVRIIGKIFSLCYKVVVVAFNFALIFIASV